MAMRTNHIKQARGFTLIELLVVIALIGLVTLVSLPTVSSVFQVSLSAASRELASVIKEAYNAAMITGKVHRIAYNLKSGEFWVESGPATALLETAASEEKRARRERFSTGRGSGASSSSEFSLDKSITRSKKTLPRGVEFTSVLSERDKAPLSEGTAYTHIFPSGITERSLIQLSDSQKHDVSLVIEPIGGRTRMLQGKISAKEAFGDGS
ncbi:MAG: hypothetical protein RJB38_225 [Pseudomonadota bacterium]|jgi:prepilin-type N-terminal cleavage/methylation domain-containing protein